MNFSREKSTTGNYGGLLNVIDGHSGASGTTSDKLLIYLDTYYPKAND